MAEQKTTLVGVDKVAEAFGISERAGSQHCDNERRHCSQYDGHREPRHVRLSLDLADPRTAGATTPRARAQTAQSRAHDRRMEGFPARDEMRPANRPDFNGP
jgi:hypothetical protein